MDKLILCLANSYKHGGRCIAGVEVELKDSNLSIVKSQYGIPNWIRPVSHSVAGEVPMCDARDINVLSVVKIHGVSYAGNGSHSEDYYYQSLEPMQFLNPSDTFLKEYTDTWHSTIFGNRGRALTPEAFENGDYSVMLIRTEGAEVYLDTRYEPKPRIKFTHNRNTYDFPITDPIFLDRLHCNDSLYHDNYGVLYIVTSLGVVHDGWHSKLAATIITPATSNIKETITAQPTRPAQTPHIVQPKTDTTSSGIGPYVACRPSVTTQETIYDTLKERNVIPPIQMSSSNTTPNRPSNTSNSGGCYIATSIYGSYDCPEVWTLRRFRDYTLSQSYMGRLFIRTYYATSPKLVKWFGKSSSFRRIFKPGLDKLVSSLKDKGYESTPYTDR